MTRPGRATLVFKPATLQRNWETSPRKVKRHPGEGGGFWEREEGKQPTRFENSENPISQEIRARDRKPPPAVKSFNEEETPRISARFYFKKNNY